MDKYSLETCVQATKITIIVWLKHKYRLLFPNSIENCFTQKNIIIKNIVHAAWLKTTAVFPSYCKSLNLLKPIDPRSLQLLRALIHTIEITTT